MKHAKQTGARLKSKTYILVYSLVALSILSLGGSIALNQNSAQAQSVALQSSKIAVPVGQWELECVYGH